MKNFCIFIFSALFCLSCATDSFGVYHTVKKGENITKISQLYNIDENKLRKENSIPEGVDELKEGSAIFIPGTDEVIETQPVSETPAEVEQTELTQPAPDETQPQPEETLKPENEPEQEHITPEEPEAENGETMQFIWPAVGKIVQNFSSNNPKSDGIDIEFEKSTEIHAVADGKVIYSASHSNFGNMVIIQHDNNIITVYAYLHTIFAKEGLSIKQNSVLGIADANEKKSVPTLHFEVRKTAKPADPMKYLPEN